MISLVASAPSKEKGVVCLQQQGRSFGMLCEAFYVCWGSFSRFGRTEQIRNGQDDQGQPDSDGLTRTYAADTVSHNVAIQPCVPYPSSFPPADQDYSQDRTQSAQAEMGLGVIQYVQHKMTEIVVLKAVHFSSERAKTEDSGEGRTRRLREPICCSSE